MTTHTQSGEGRKSPTRRAAGWGGGSLAAGFTTIIVGGGQSGIDNVTLRFAIALFAFVLTAGLLVTAFQTRAEGDVKSRRK
jgi:hypothetical protein